MERHGDRSTVTPLVIPEIIALPAEIDVTNAGQVARELRAAFRPGVAVVIADMSATTFCDSSGMRSLLLARDTAITHHAELRLVIPTADVLRALSLLGFDQLLQIYPSLSLALTAAQLDS
jgi:anti-sigma B factor antagonist